MLEVILNCSGSRRQRLSATERAGLLADGHEVQLWRLVAELKFDDPRHRPKRRRSARTPMH